MVVLVAAPRVVVRIGEEAAVAAGPRDEVAELPPSAPHAPAAAGSPQLSVVAVQPQVVDGAHGAAARVERRGVSILGLSSGRRGKELLLEAPLALDAVNVALDGPLPVAIAGSSSISLVGPRGRSGCRASGAHEGREGGGRREEGGGSGEPKRRPLRAHLAEGAELLVPHEPSVDTRAAEHVEARLQDGLFIGVQDVGEALWGNGTSKG